MRRAGIDTKGTIFTKSVQLLGFADDIGIIARNLAMVKETYTRLKAEAMQMGLAMNKIHERKGVENWEPLLSNTSGCGWR